MFVQFRKCNHVRNIPKQHLEQALLAAIPSAWTVTDLTTAHVSSRNKNLLYGHSDIRPKPHTHHSIKSKVVFTRSNSLKYLRHLYQSLFLLLLFRENVEVLDGFDASHLRAHGGLTSTHKLARVWPHSPSCRRQSPMSAVYRFWRQCTFAYCLRSSRSGASRAHDDVRVQSYARARIRCPTHLFTGVHAEHLELYFGELAVRGAVQKHLRRDA